MAVRFRKSVKLGPGVRMNVGKRGVGLSVGTRGARYSVHSSGRRTASVGLPGTGLGYLATSGGGRTRSSGGARAAAPTPTPEPMPFLPPKPRMLAPAHEKAFHRGVEGMLRGDTNAALLAFREASQQDAADKASSDELMAGLLSAQIGDQASAVWYLERVVASPVALPDPLMQKYLPPAELEIGITENVRVEVEIGSLAGTLTLAECYQRADRLDEAIGLIQQLYEVYPDRTLQLCLCDLLIDARAYDEANELAAGVPNDDDVGLQLRLLQARALAGKGMNEAALEVCRECLRSKKRDPELLKQARYMRGVMYHRLGKKAQARKDWNTVYADDPNYLDVAALLADR